MKNIFLIFTAILFLTGCGTKVEKVPVDNQDTLESKYVSFRAPALSWYLYDDKKWVIQGNGKAHMINVYNRSKKGTSYTIGVDAYPFSWMSIDILFDKDGDYEARDKYLSNTPETLAQNKEQGISYDKDWITYINGLKCTGGGCFPEIMEEHSTVQQQKTTPLLVVTMIKQKLKMMVKGY